MREVNPKWNYLRLGFLHRVILLWSNGGSSLKELSLGFFRPLMFLWARCWRFILDIVSLGFLHPLVLWWVDAGGSSINELTHLGFFMQ